MEENSIVSCFKKEKVKADRVDGGMKQWEEVTERVSVKQGWSGEGKGGDKEVSYHSRYRKMGFEVEE